MTRRISMTIGVAAALLLLAILAGMVGLLYARPFTAQTSAGVQGMRPVTVVGHGEVNGAQSQEVQKKLTELGVDAKDIQTSNFSINPTYASDGRQVTGYHVSNMVT